LHSATTPLTTHVGSLGNDGFDWPVLLRLAAQAEFNTSQSGPQLTMSARPSREVVSAMESVGRLLAGYATGGGTPRLLALATDRVSSWLSQFTQRCDALVLEYVAEKAPVASAEVENQPVNSLATPTESPRYTVRVLGPNDRLAMLSAPTEPTSPQPWCVPQTLFALVDRLGEQAESAQWASHVRNELHALTDRKQLEGDDVDTILGDLSDAAQEAERMADHTENDRLRVALLRAHWALARRLDCWAAMHEKRVAMRLQNRVAARGSLGPYFERVTGHSATVHDASALSQNLETYESTGDPTLGRYLADQEQKLQSSSSAVDRTLAEAMEQHYRNANIRVAVTAAMLNRLAGQSRDESNIVRDRVAGTFVRGMSDTRSNSRVLLDPSADSWQLELTAKGVVESNTLADGGPVQFRNHGTTNFAAREKVVVNDKGIHFKQTDANAYCRNRLVGVTTDYDWVPIFGSIVRDRALDEYGAKQGRARFEIESRVESQARESLDEQTREAVDRIRQRTYDRFAAQLDQFDIKLTPVEMKTTAERLVARVRLASDQQLGSHTPRPRALSDSLASVQVNETALTNLAVTLGLDGKRYTARELQQKIREKLPKIAVNGPLKERHETVFQFAPQDAVQAHIHDGRLELTIAFAAVEFDHEVMPKVVVHAYYTPSVAGLNAELVRDRTLGIEGRLDSVERAELHNIFNRVLPPERHLPVVHIDTEHEKAFEGLMITQLVMEDGWLGMAVGPTREHRVAQRSRSLR
ncbi:MAG TPA: hypothetical protein VHE81_22905, partial [Lacipirellulaceae bacterium]|nr:hypothetical protein [Lacipirellulaceae bacterium]